MNTMKKLVFALAFGVVSFGQTPLPSPFPIGGNGGGVGTGTVTSIATACGISGGTITTTGTLRRSETQNAQTGTTDTIADDDCGKLITYSNGASVAVTLPQANGSTFISGWFVDTANLGAGTVTITPTTSTIDGAASITLTTSQGVRIVSNGTNYFSVRGKATGSGISGLTTNVLTKALSSTTIGDSIISDDGTTATVDGALVADSIATGAAPPTCTAGTAGVFCAKEGTAPTGAADVGMLYPNPTATAWKTKLNNGAEDEICQVTLANCGGGNTPPVDSTTAGNGINWVTPPCTYCVSGTINNADPHQIIGVQFMPTAIQTSRYATFGPKTASGTSCTGGVCGLVLEVLAADKSTVLCLSEVATSGNATSRLNIDQTTDTWAMAWVSGADVSAGVCTLPAGLYWAVWTTDSLALQVVAAGNTDASAMVNVNSIRWGYQGAVATGNGASIAFPSGARTFSTLSPFNYNQPSIAFLN